MRILIAEDDATSRMILEKMLAKWGYTVESVDRGDEAAFRLINPEAPKLAILDRSMPGMEGTEVCRCVKAVESANPPYLILLTSQGEIKDIVEGLDAGANDYIAKPYNFEELHARIRVGQRVVELQDALCRQVKELQEASQHIKVLQGILPICCFCHKIRSDEQSWQLIDHYIAEHSNAQFSHGVCPDCLEKHYGEFSKTASNRGERLECGE